MIFDNAVLTPMVMVWQQTHDKKLLDRVMLGCKALIEVIVSQFSSLDREDLLQEAKARVIYALPHYDVTKSSLHNYLTTVVLNVCRTWSMRESKHDCEELIANPLEFARENSSEILNDLLIHNRIRFPFIDVESVDGITEIIYTELCNGCHRRVVITLALSSFPLSRKQISLIYDASIIYMRSQYACRVKLKGLNESNESLLPELKDLLGEDNYKKLIVTFSGITIKIP